MIEQVSARTVGYAQSNSIFSDPHFTNVIGKLTAQSGFTTRDSLGLAGALNGKLPEVECLAVMRKVPLKRILGRHVIFSFSNPSKGQNTCSIENTGTPLTHKECTITQHSGLYDPAKAKYIVSTIRLH